MRTRLQKASSEPPRDSSIQRASSSTADSSALIVPPKSDRYQNSWKMGSALLRARAGRELFQLPGLDPQVVVAVQVLALQRQHLQSRPSVRLFLQRGAGLGFENLRRRDAAPVEAHDRMGVDDAAVGRVVEDAARDGGRGGG